VNYLSAQAGNRIGLDRQFLRSKVRKRVRATEGINRKRSRPKFGDLVSRYRGKMTESVHSLEGGSVISRSEISF
jgi:hypothetical protein